jgi:transcriptional regulator with XRE-family HTH domain
METEFKTVADRIRDLRMRKNLTQDYLAKSLGVTQKAYSKIENSETRLNVDTLVNIARVLETPVTEFFSENSAPVLNDFSNRTGGDNMIYKTESDQAKEKLIEQLIQSKEEVISAKQAEIDVLRRYIEKIEGKW